MAGDGGGLDPEEEGHAAAREPAGAVDRRLAPVKGEIGGPLGIRGAMDSNGGFKQFSTKIYTWNIHGSGAGWPVAGAGPPPGRGVGGCRMRTVPRQPTAQRDPGTGQAFPDSKGGGAEHGKEYGARRLRGVWGCGGQGTPPMCEGVWGESQDHIPRSIQVLPQGLSGLFCCFVGVSNP